MKELFAGFLSVSISTSLLICLILLIRLAFKKAPKAFICILWAVLIIRLCIPLQLETTWTLRPELPVITEQDTQLFIDSEPMLVEEIPSIIPKQIQEGTYFAVVDYLKIATVLWLFGVCVIGIYTLISYLRLKFWVQEAFLQEKGVYISANVESAFLLGYLQPKIYLPASISDNEKALVISHEKAHIRRGDNWLKLLGFISLVLHWFNPLVWICYVLLCMDIEDACDERVIRSLDPEARKAYCQALLACGEKSRKVFGCPVAFGEISIRKRILNILNYQKPRAWICIALVILLVLVPVFLFTDPIVQENPPYYEILQDSLGQPVDVVCENLGISETELISMGARTGLYNTPLNAEFEGVIFTVQLGFNIGNDLLSGFTYHTTYDGNYEQAATDIVKVSNRLWNNFGKGYQWYESEDPMRLKENTEEEIKALFSERGMSTLAYDQWNLTHQASKATKTWLDQIEASYLWQTNYAERARLYGVSAHYYMEYKAIYDKDNDKTYVNMTYYTGWQPGHYGATFTGE